MNNNEYKYQSSVKRTIVKINDKEYILRTIGLSEEVIKKLIDKKILEINEQHNK